MRVPTSLLHDRFVFEIGRSLMRIDRLRSELATGRRILRPSDDPSGTVRALGLRRSLDASSQLRRNIGDGREWNTSLETSVNAVVDTLTQLKELAIQGASEVPMDRGVLGTSADAHLSELCDQTQTMHNGMYIYSGHRTSEAPYEFSYEVVDEVLSAGAVGEAVDLAHARLVAGSVTVGDLSGAVTFAEGVDYEVDYQTGRVTLLPGGAMVEGANYLVDYQTEGISSVTAAIPLSGDVVRQIDENRTLTVNMLASEVFDPGVDLFQMTIDLKNALWRDDPDAVQGMLDTIESALQGATRLLGEIGIRAQTLDTQDYTLETQELVMEGILGDVEGADLAETVLKLETEQMGYEAALAAAARLYQVSLVSFL